MSKGSEQLKEILLELYGSHTVIEEEYALDNRLRLDFYLPKYSLGIEYHGRQHEEFVEHFHHDAVGFWEAKQRDINKIQQCLDKGIYLVIFWYYDKLTKELVYERILEVLSDTEFDKEESVVNEFREQQNALRREANRRRYQWQKERKNSMQS